MFMRPYSSSGVAVRKYSTKLGFWNTTERYSLVETSAMESINPRHSGLGAIGGCMPCSRVAAVNRCSVRKQRCCSPNDCSMTSPWIVTRSLPLMVSGGWDRIARWVGPPPLPTVPPRPWNIVRRTPYCFATFTKSSCALNICQAADNRPASLPESEYPIITSCLPLIRFRYQSIENRRDRAAGAASKSASFSNKGTTRSGLGTRHSRCRSSTTSTSEGAVAIEMTYAPKQSDGSSAITLNVSNTSLISSVMGKSSPKRGRFPRSSVRSHSWRCSSVQLRYEPMPRCVVMASITSVWRSDSCRMSSFTRPNPKHET